MLEYIVRPFQAVPVLTTRRSAITTAVKRSNETPLIVIGAVGQSPDIFSFTLKVIDPDNKPNKEISRKTTDVRIENPDDKSQFVVAQRIDSIQFSRELPPPSTTDAGKNLSGNSGGADPSTAYKQPPDPTIVPTGDNPTIDSKPVDPNTAPVNTAKSEYELDPKAAGPSEIPLP
jgi:hypothetical protein